MKSTSPVKTSTVRNGETYDIRHTFERGHAEKFACQKTCTVPRLHRVLVDNLCVDNDDVSEAAARETVETWLGVEGDVEAR